MNGQQLSAFDLIRTGFQLFDVPIDPHELALEELSFRGCEPDVEVAWQFD